MRKNVLCHHLKIVRNYLADGVEQMIWSLISSASTYVTFDASDGKTSDVVLSDYHNYTQLMEELDTLVESYSDLSRLYILGTTVEERDIPVIQISKGVKKV